VIDCKTTVHYLFSVRNMFFSLPWYWPGQYHSPVHHGASTANALMEWGSCQFGPDRLCSRMFIYLCSV
jgi:hypothetical protein